MIEAIMDAMKRELQRQTEDHYNGIYFREDDSDFATIDGVVNLRKLAEVARQAVADNVGTPERRPSATLDAPQPPDDEEGDDYLPSMAKG